MFDVRLFVLRSTNIRLSFLQGLPIGPRLQEYPPRVKILFHLQSEQDLVVGIFIDGLDPFAFQCLVQVGYLPDAGQ